MVATSKLNAAKRMAQLHFEVEPDLKRVFLLGPVRDDDPREPIKLLEVVEGAIERWIEPVSFPSDRTHGIDFPSVIVELSPREFGRISGGEIAFRDQVWPIEQELTASA